MKISSLLITAVLFIFVILLPNIINGRRVACTNHSLGDSGQYVEFMQKKVKKGREVVGRRAPITVQVAGSSLPDCSHACGSCWPCRLVMVSFICEEEAETCPMAYKCMCHRKTYPVP